MGCSTSSHSKTVPKKKNSLGSGSNQRLNNVHKSATAIKTIETKNNKNLNIVKLQAFSFSFSKIGLSSSIEDNKLETLNNNKLPNILKPMDVLSKPRKNNIAKCKNQEILVEDKRGDKKSHHKRVSSRLPFLSKRAMISIALKSESLVSSPSSSLKNK